MLPYVLLNRRIRRSDVDSILVVEQWGSCLPLQGYWRGHESLPIWSTCVLWTMRRQMKICKSIILVLRCLHNVLHFYKVPVALLDSTLPTPLTYLFNMTLSELLGLLAQALG